VKIKDIELKEENPAKELVRCFASTGFQASSLADAVELIAEMKRAKATIFFSFTANMVASGLRGVFAELCRKKFVDAVVTTAGSIDHDVIKSFLPYEVGAFDVDDVALHRKGINRIGNIFVPTAHFEFFEEKMRKWLKELYGKEKMVSPMELCDFIGSKLNEKNSFLYWCHKNKIPVFCPGIVDGAIGLQAHFFKQDHPNFGIDVTKDMRNIATLVLGAKKTAAIILGGGISKHYTIGSNLLRGGLDYAIYVSTAAEWDGSLSGARTREAKSWGKIKEKAREVNVFGDATILFPLIVAALKEEKVV
jgi:deoxyhypusine synthase